MVIVHIEISVLGCYSGLHVLVIREHAVKVPTGRICYSCWLPGILSTHGLVQLITNPFTAIPYYNNFFIFYYSSLNTSFWAS